MGRQWAQWDYLMGQNRKYYAASVTSTWRRKTGPARTGRSGRTGHHRLGGPENQVDNQPTTP
jgi:hypothetical protein